jgi:putative membrane protein
MLLKILATFISVLWVSRALPGIHLKGWGTALGVAVVYSILHALLFKLLLVLAAPLVLLTFGLFAFVLNAFLLWLTDKLIDGFKINSFLTTLGAAVLISLSNLALLFLLTAVF